MSRLFITVLNMSLTASYVALVVIFIRMLLGKFSKIFLYTLGNSVVQTLCPISIGSSLSPASIKVLYLMIYTRQIQTRFG